jgi:hypothetical protein
MPVNDLTFLNDDKNKAKNTKPNQPNSSQKNVQSPKLEVRPSNVVTQSVSKIS